MLEPLVSGKEAAERDAALTAAFTTITFGGTCSLPEKVNLSGAIAVKLPSEDAIKPVLKVKTFEIAGGTIKRSLEQELLGAILKFGANEAFYENEVELELTGSGASLKWGAM